MFDAIFKNSLQDSLRQNTPMLKEATCDYIYSITHSYYRILINNAKWSIESLSNKTDYLINKTIKIYSKENQPILQNRINISPYNFEDEINFYHTIKYYNDESYDPTIIAWNKITLIRKCINEFYSVDANKYNYNSFSSFECFTDKVISDIEYEKYINYGDLYNIEDWSVYIVQLIKYFFDDFEYSAKFSTNKIYRFTQPLNSNIFWGFEVDINKLRKGLMCSEISIDEDFFNLILFTDDFNKNVTQNNYRHRANNLIISLGLLQNPIFRHCITTITSYIYLETFSSGSEIDFTKMKYFREFIKMDSDKILVKHSIEKAEFLKKYSFYYFAILSDSSKSYLKYIKESLEFTIKNYNK